MKLPQVERSAAVLPSLCEPMRVDIRLDNLTLGFSDRARALKFDVKWEYHGIYPTRERLSMTNI